MIEYILIDTDNGLDINGLPVNLKGKPRLINGNLIQVFNTVEERDLFVSNMPNPFDLDDYKQQVNEAHNALFRSLYNQYNYLSIGELSLWVNDAQYGTEATMLRDWWIETCKLVSTYLESVTEETALPIEDFIETLPKI